MADYRKAMGDVMEDLAVRVLQQAGFSDVQNVNAWRANHMGGDVLATRKRKRYFISVKARNKLQQNGSLNPSYNIYPDKVRTAAKAYKAMPAWVTISVVSEKQQYSAYFGLIDKLPAGVGVSMRPESLATYECLAANRISRRIKPEWSNQKSSRALVKRTKKRRQAKKTANQPRVQVNGSAKPSMMFSLREIETLKSLIRRIVKEYRDLPSRGDLVGTASGAVLNIVRLRNPGLARKIGSRERLVKLARSFGFVIRGYKGGAGRKRQTIWETIDLP